MTVVEETYGVLEAGLSVSCLICRGDSDGHVLCRCMMNLVCLCRRMMEFTFSAAAA